MLTLDQGVVGKIYQVTGFKNNLKQETHLKNLGLSVGSSLHFIEKQKTGGILVIKEAKVALDNELLKEILITEETHLNKISLSQLPVGQNSHVAAVLGTGAVKRRLLDMGITKGVSLYLRKKAPLGDPLQIKVRGYELSLRKAEADLIMVYEENK